MARLYRMNLLVEPISTGPAEDCGVGIPVSQSQHSIPVDSLQSHGGKNHDTASGDRMREEKDEPA